MPMHFQRLDMKKLTGPMFYKWLLSYAIILMISISLIGYVSYNRMMLMSSHQNQEMYGKKFEKLSSVMEAGMMELKDLGVRISIAPWANKAMGVAGNIDERLDIFNIKDISRELDNYRHMSKIISYISIILPNSDCVLSVSGKDAIQSFFFYNNKFSNSYTDTILSSLDKFHFFTVLNECEVSVFEKKIKAIPVIQSLEYPESGTPAATLLMLINKDALMKMANSHNLDTGVRFGILYHNNEMVGDIDTDIIMKEKLQNKLSDGGNNIVKLERKECIIYALNSELAPWSYVYIVPGSVMAVSAKIFGGYIVFTIFIFFIGFLLSAAIAMKNYNPLYKLASKVSKMRSTQVLLKKCNEFELIEDSVDLMLREQKVDKEKISRYMPIVRDNMLKKLTQGYFATDSESRKILEELDLKTGSNVCYGVIVAGLENSNLILKPDIIMAMDTIQKIVEANGYKVQAFEGEEARIVSIICFDIGCCDSSSKFAKLSVIIKDSLCDSIGMDVYIGSGDISSNAAGISKSYQKAKKIVEWLLFTKDDSPESIARYSECSSAFYFYPTDWEIQMINHLKSGNLKSVRDILKEIKYENCINRSLAFDVFKRLIMEIVETHLKAIDELKLEGVWEDYEYRAVMESGTETAMWQYINNIGSAICNKVIYNHKKGMENQDEEIVQYIIDHYQNPSISLKEISIKFNTTIPMVSKIFKNITGSNFLDYINRKRILLAKELLKETENEIYIISGIIGYTSDISFRRIFKKYEGVSPTEYRDICRN